MRLRRRLLFGVAAVLGIAMVVLPAIASSEAAPAISAYSGEGVYANYWTPAAATVGENGVVMFSNPSAKVKHGVNWVSTPGGARPSCNGVPVGTTEADSGTGWSGTCTFTTPGAYTFYCTVHGPEMTGTVTVGANGASTTTMSVGSAEAPAPGSPPGGSTAVQGSGEPTSAAGSPDSLLRGTPLSAVKLAHTQHGHSVHGSVAVSDAGAGGTLQVRLLARAASIGQAGHSREVQVGRSVRSSLSAGINTFTVALNAPARRSMSDHGQLALSAKILLTSAHGVTVTVTRSALVRG